MTVFLRQISALLSLVITAHVWASSLVDARLLTEFHKPDTSRFLAELKLEDVAGVWEPQLITPASRFEPIPKRNEASLAIPFDPLEIRRGQVEIRHGALSRNPRDTFRCRVTRDRQLLMCKSPCGGYFSVFERGMMSSSLSARP